MRPFIFPILFLTLSAQAQWTIQTAPTTADLRGIDSVGNGVAWASGTKGTVLRTEDMGKTWQTCAVPTGAEALDFRGVQAFDAKTAIVMSSGKGDLSRLYKTTDGCATWKLVFTNPDKDGFWDAVQFTTELNNTHHGVLIGDPVDGKVAIFQSFIDGEDWKRWGRSHDYKKGICGEHAANARNGESLFAASNESLIVGQHWDSRFLFVTGGHGDSRVWVTDFMDFDGPPCWSYFDSSSLPIGSKTDSSGAFAVATNQWNSNFPQTLIIVGGDYKQPNQMSRTAAFAEVRTGFRPFSPVLTVTAATIPPHGYRSAVAYDTSTKTWITVGPNGTDISTDDGRNWRALKPIVGDAADADQHWNALSLPFVVGPKGRIGLLEAGALKAAVK
jgi:hypothetical protein